MSAWTAQGAAQVPEPPTLDPELHITQYIHKAWQVEDGLPQNSVFAIAQTQDGYLWLGTQEGLVRFDGVRFTVFDKSRVDVLKSNVIRVLLEDRKGALWIGTDGGGLGRLYNGRFTTYTTEDGLSSNAVRALYEDRQGHLWIGTIGGGLSRFDGTSFTHYAAQEGLVSDVVLTISEDQAGDLWVGTEAGLYRLQNGRFTRYTAQQGLPDDQVWALLTDEAGALWIGTRRGLARRDGEMFTAFTTHKEFSGSTVSTLYQDRAGTLWIGMLGGGLYRFADGRFSAFTTEHGLTHDYVRALYEDREGNLWIGTDGGGLNQLASGKFTPITTAEGLSANVVLSVLEDQDGAIWIGTEGGGLNRLHEGQITHVTTEDGLPSSDVYALHEDRQGRLWIGTFNGGLCHLEQEHLACFTTVDGLSSNDIYSVYEDSKGDLWIGTVKGLNRLRDGQFTVYTTDDGLASDFITALHEDQRGDLWVGTYGGGLSRLRGERIINYGTEYGFPTEVLVIHEDAQGTLWIGTDGGGLCRFRNERFTCYTTKEGLHSDKVLQILEDDADNLWLGSLNGISRVSKKALDAYDLVSHYKNEVDAVIPVVYGEADGLKSRETNGGTQPAAWRTREGQLLFSTLRGLATIDPDHIQTNPVPPPVVLESISVDGERAATAEEPVTLPPGSRRIEFHYTALSLVAPQKVRFMYKLEGYDEAWIDAGTRRDAYYTNLPPRTYRFRVKARNNDGVWSEGGDAFEFEVEPFFYQTGWFYVLCLIALVLAAAALYRLRVRQLQAHQRKLEQRVREQTAELLEREQELEALNANLEHEVQCQLDVILEERERYEAELIAAKERAEGSSRLKSSILRNMSHEIRTPIAAILGFTQILAEEVSEAQREFTTYIEENGNRLLQTLNSLLDLSRLETDSAQLQLGAVDVSATAQDAANLLAPAALKKGLSLKVELPPHPVEAHLDKAALDRILHNLVGNAIKFTEVGGVCVKVNRRQGRVYLSISDTGIGISEAFLPNLFEAFEQESSDLARSHEGSGLGLGITRRLVEAMSGTITVKTQKGEGSTFTVSFPSAVAPEDRRPISHAKAWTDGKVMA